MFNRLKILKSKKFFIVFLLLFFIAFTSTYSAFPRRHVYGYYSDYNGSTSSEIVMEASSRRVLYAHNIHEKKYMASTTKILTAITVIENCDVNASVTVTAKTVGIEGSSIYLEAGEKLTVKDLLLGLMLRSGNDCAATLAVYCSKSVEKFAALMNDTAKKAGAFDSNFVNPHGLHDDNHYTTAYDLALISCYAMQNPVFREIVSTQKADIPFTTHDTKRHLINKNKLLKNMEGATGIKTGFTKKAGRCLVGSCKKDGMELISVVLNCPPMFERTENLLNNCFENYALYNLINSENIIDFIPIENSEEKCGVHIKSDVVLPLTEEERAKLTISYNLPETLNENVKNDEEIGSVEIYCENNLIFTQKIYTIIG